MSELLGEKIIIDNRAGAGGTVGTSAVAKSGPDGYTLVLGYTGTLAIGPSLYKNVGYDPRKDFAPIGMIGNAPNSLVVNPSFPAKTLAELIAYAKANPGKVNFGSAGAGTASHITGEYFARSAGITLVHIPYKGTGPRSPICSAAISRWRSRRSRPRTAMSPPASCARSRSPARRGRACCPTCRRSPKSGLRGIRRLALLRSCRAGRHAAADHRQAQQGAARCARLRRGEEAARQ